MAAIALLAELAYAVVNNSTLPVYIKYGLDLPKFVGMAIAAFLLSEALLSGPTGLLADRIGRRPLMMIGPMLSVFTCVVTAQLHVPAVHHPGHLRAIIELITLRFLDGAGAACLWPAVFGTIGDRIAPARQSTAMGVLNVSYMMGVAFGPLIGGFLNDFYAKRMPIDLHDPLHLHDPLRYIPSFAVAAVAFLITAIIGMIVGTGRSAQRRTAIAGSAVPEGGPVTLAAIGDALRRIPSLLFLVFVVFFGIGLIAPNVMLYAIERLHTTPAGYGTLLLYPALVVGALSVPLGRLGDIWGKARAIRIGMAICALSMWMILLFESELALVVLGSLLGVGFVLAFPAYMALLSQIGGCEARGSVIGAAKTFQGVGMLLGAAAGSPLYERHGLAPFVAAGVMLTIGFVLSLVGIPDSNPAPAASVAP